MAMKRFRQTLRSVFTRARAAGAPLAGLIGWTLAAGASVAAEVDFEKDVRPLLEAKCAQCHGPDTQKNGLRLDTGEGILTGGESGDPLFVKNDSAASLIIRRVTSTDSSEVMPPKGERLTSEEVAVLKTWIDGGARIPGEEAIAARLAGSRLTTDHWSFQPVRRPDVPPGDETFVINKIDAFVLEKLRGKGLTPSAPADRRTLIRRLYLVMHGLPPSPREVEKFVNDRRPDAYERLVDQVLASPRYGERWARHWLDVVRYADSNGFETNRERKTAWPYRDYVIEAFNSDKPYDVFIREQLAGDAMDADAATGFLVAGPYDIVKSPDVNLSLMQRQDELADMVNTTGTAFLGLTMGCARCHNHKFDPIPQKDYFAMQAVFAGVNHGERPIRRKLTPSEMETLTALNAALEEKTRRLEGYRRKAEAETVTTASTLRPPVDARFNEERFPAVEAAAVRFVILETNGGEACLDELEIFDGQGRNVALASSGAKVSASGSLKGYPIHKLEHLNDGRHGNGHSWISNTTGECHARVDLPRPAGINRIVWSRDRQGQFKDRLATRYRVEVAGEDGEWRTVASSDDRTPPGIDKSKDDWFIARLGRGDAATARALFDEVSDLKKRIESLTSAGVFWGGTFAQPEVTRRLHRGEPTQPREEVAPGALTVLGGMNLPLDAPEQRRRIELGKWIASPENPLTARVMVNRLWHYIFGNGIVDTPSDFGVNGGRPTHPELLDWLADEFVSSGWSIKHVQRLILLSSTFRQSSAPRPDALAVDADGRFLWRFTPRRLEGEAIRDSMLAVSGALDLKIGGPGFYLVDVVEENVMHYFEKEKFTPAEFRRMIYQTRIRQTGDGVFNSFDCPDGSQIMPRRARSTTPLQALNLFNSAFVTQQAGILADRLRAEAGDAPEDQAALAFPLFFARPPDAFEFRESVSMIRSHGLEAFCRALYNTSEFLFVF